MTTTNSLQYRIAKAASAVAILAAVAVTAACAGGTADSVTGEGAGNAASTPSSTPISSAGRHQQNICGGMGIDHAAAITSSHDLLIEAPIRRVWDVQTEVEHWDDWQRAVQTIKRLDPGDFGVGSQFRWTTPVPESQFSPADTLTITSTVKQVEPGTCVLWAGPAIGESVRIDKGVHLWTFTETDKGTLVHTEESWDADALAALEGPDAEAAEEMLGGGLKVWLADLKTEAESQA